MAAIKLFNQYTRLCKLCKDQTVRIGPRHVKQVHGIELPEPVELVTKINDEVKSLKEDMKKKGLRFERMKILSRYDELCMKYAKFVKTLTWEKIEIEIVS